MRNILNESVEKSSQLYFTLHCRMPCIAWVTALDLNGDSDSSSENTETLVYTSETVYDTVNPEWNDFGNPIDIMEEAKNQKGLSLCCARPSRVHPPRMEQSGRHIANRNRVYLCRPGSRLPRSAGARRYKLSRRPQRDEYCRARADPRQHESPGHRADLQCRLSVLPRL